MDAIWMDCSSRFIIQQHHLFEAFASFSRQFTSTVMSFLPSLRCRS